MLGCNVMFSFVDSRLERNGKGRREGNGIFRHGSEAFIPGLRCICIRIFLCCCLHGLDGALDKVVRMHQILT